MTQQEKDRIQNAIRHIQTAVDVDPWAVEIAVGAMERQDAKIIPIRNGDEFATCPNCGHDLMYHREGFCEWCGQKYEMHLFDSRDKDKKISLEDAEYAIEQLPSAQPEIIRCKDCKWWSNDDYRECSNPNYDDGYVTPAGFYCGYAERRTDD